MDIKRKLAGLMAVCIVTLKTGPVLGDRLEYFELPDQDLIIAGESYLRLKSIDDRFKMGLAWNNKEKYAYFKGRDIKIYPLSQEVLVKGRPVDLKNKPFLDKGSVYVPYELVAKVLDLDPSVAYGNLLVKPGSKDDLVVKPDRELGIKLDDYLTYEEKNRNFMGSVLVARGNEIVFTGSYGYNNKKENIKNRPETTFGIGSITKQFVAVSILQLEEKGLLSVEDSLDKYLADYKYGKEIRLKNLLNHSSGIVGFTNTGDFLSLVNKSSQEDMYGLIKNEDLLFKPGSNYNYSNSNYLILGMVVEKVSGLSLEDYIEENILSKLGMDSTGVAYGKEGKYPMATAYSGHIDIDPVDDSYIIKRAYGAGNMYSNVYDLFRWYRGLKEGKILSQASLEKLVNRDREVIKDQAYYGYGVMTMVDEEMGSSYFHNGNTLGYTSSSGYFKDQDLYVAVLSNKGYENVENIYNNLARLASNKEATREEELKELSIGPKDLEKYTGDYTINVLDQDLACKVFIKDGGLYVELEGQPSARVYYMGDHRFFYKEVDAKLKFDLVDGEVKGFVLNQSGLDFKAKKKGVEEVYIPKENIEKYVGEYETDNGFLVVISYDDGLYIKVDGLGKIKLTQWAERKFKVRGVEGSLVFNEENNGFTIYQGITKLEFTKVY